MGLINSCVIKDRYGEEYKYTRAFTRGKWVYYCPELTGDMDRLDYDVLSTSEYTQVTEWE